MTDLRKWSTTVYKSSSPSDARQIPASTATVDVYRRGATIAVGTAMSGSGAQMDVEVYSLGNIIEGDTLQVGTGIVNTVSVIAIVSSTVITVQNDNVHVIAFPQFTRLVIISRRPLIYRESTAVEEVAGGIQGQGTTNSLGFIELYTFEERFDWIVTGTGVTTRCYVDEESGAKTPSWVNVTKYATFQDAIDAIPESGGTLYVPAGIYDRTTVPQVVPMTVDNKSVHFLGETAAKPRPAVTGSQIMYSGGSPDLTSDLLTIGGTAAEFGVKIENLTFVGAGATGSGRGLVVSGCHLLEVDNCVFQEFPSWAVSTTDGATECVHMHFNKVDMLDSHSNGVCGMGVGLAGDGSGSAERVWATRFSHCNFISNYPYRLLTLRKNVLTTIRDSSFQFGAVNTTNMEAIYVGDGSNAIRRIVIAGCYMGREAFVAAIPDSWMIRLVGPIHATVKDNLFINQTGTNSGRAVAFEGAGNIGRIVLENNQLVKDSGSWTGLDDIERAGTAAEFLLINNSRQVAGTGGSTDPWRLSSTVNMARLFDGEVGLKMRDQTLAVLAAEANLNGGELASRVDPTNIRGQLVSYIGQQWTSIMTQIWGSAGKPNTGIWEVGDIIFNTNDKFIYVCTTRGEAPGTAVFYKTTLALVPA